MRLSLQWINDFVEISDLPPETIEDIITTKIAEAEGLETVAAPLEFARLVQVVKLEPHPKKDSLKLATVYDGTETVTVVCGAPNIAKGQYVAYLPPESRYELNSSHELGYVEAKEVSGVRSAGFLASERELGLSAEEDGIFLVPGEADELDKLLGERLSVIVGKPDYVVEIDNKSLTHRPDLWCHFGFARELSAILHRPLVSRPDLAADIEEHELAREIFSAPSVVKTAIDVGCGCRRFAAIRIDGVSCFTSPLWLRRRLYAVGAGVRNILVDLSNYVMNDIGQPNHTYDARKISGGELRARLAKHDERFLALDGTERVLSAEDIVIADQSGAVALAGVIGGASTAIGDDTSSVFLESANFDPVSVRRAAKRHAVRTDASNRFEKSQSPLSVPLALTRYVELLRACAQETGNNLPTLAGAVDCYAEPPNAVSIHFSMEMIRHRLGAPLTDDQIGGTLRALGFRLHTPAHQAPDAEWICDVPYYRSTRDISIAEDLVEEVGRIFGYDNVEERAPSIISSPIGKDRLRAYEDEVRDLLRGVGLSETYNYSFAGTEICERMGFSVEKSIRLQNPVDATADHMRMSLLPGLFQQVILNGRQFERFGLFELGRAYQRVTADTNPLRHAGHERRLIAMAYCPGADEKSAGNLTQPSVSQGAAFYSVCGLVDRIIRLRTHSRITRLPATEATSSSIPFGSLRPWMHPHRQAVLDIDGVVFGVVSELNPAISDELPPRTVMCELDLETVLKIADGATIFEPIARFPASFFEVSVVMPVADPFIRLEEAVSREFADDAVLKQLAVLAVYEGNPIPIGHKSVSIKLSFGLEDRTLSGDELKALENRVVARIDASGYSIRS